MSKPADVTVSVGGGLPLHYKLAHERAQAKLGMQAPWAWACGPGAFAGPSCASCANGMAFYSPLGQAAQSPNEHESRSELCTNSQSDVRVVF